MLKRLLSCPSSRGYAQTQKQQEAAGETPFDLLARLFYTPPKTLEELTKVLGCSLIDEDPQIALATLGARHVTGTH